MNTNSNTQAENLAKPVLSDVLTFNGWIRTHERMPEKYKIVLLWVPFCRHKFETGFFNGLYWLTVEGVKIQNILYWSEINGDTNIEFDQEEHSKSLKSINYNFADENRKIAVLFSEWINKQVDFKYIPTDNLYINVESGQKLSSNKLYDVFLEKEGHNINIA